MNSNRTVRCRDCGKHFYIKDDLEYILSFCDGCRKLVVLYKINPAILSKVKDEKPVFVSSDHLSRCRKCGSTVTIKNKNDYYSIRCVKCGFGIVYKMDTHRGIGCFIGPKKFDKGIYWTTGKRKVERDERDEKYGK